MLLLVATFWERAVFRLIICSLCIMSAVVLFVSRFGFEGEVASVPGSCLYSLFIVIMYLFTCVHPYRLDSQFLNLSDTIFMEFSITYTSM